MCTDVVGASGLAHERHTLGISAEGVDVALHPAKRGDLIEDAIVPCCPVRAFGSKDRVREEAQSAKTIVDGDDDVTPLRNARAIVEERAPLQIESTLESLGVGSHEVATAVQKDYHR